MNFEFMTREVWDALIVGAMIFGVALAIVRLYGDFSRTEAPDDLPRRDSAHAAYPDPAPPAENRQDMETD